MKESGQVALRNRPHFRITPPIEVAPKLFFDIRLSFIITQAVKKKQKQNMFIFDSPW